MTPEEVMERKELERRERIERKSKKVCSYISIV